MVEALRKHVRLLEEYAHRAFSEGNFDYTGEVAGKLRLMAIRFGSNEPRLLRLMEETGELIPIILDGPPIPLTPQGHRGGDAISLEYFLSLLAVGVRVPSGTFVELTNADLIRAWAEQAGAPHEDWSMEEGLRTVLTLPVFIGGLPGASAALRAATNAVLHIASRFLAMVDSGEIPV